MTGTNVMTNAMPIHHNACGCMTVATKSLPASKPKQAKYVERPIERNIRLALVVV